MAGDPIAQTACPVPFALQAVRGDSINICLRLFDASTGKPIVLTGWSGIANVYASPVGGQVSHTMTVVVDQSATGQPTTGVVEITTAINETSGWIEFGSWALILSDGTTSRTIVAGPWLMAGNSLAASSFTCTGVSGAAVGACGVPQFEVIGAGCSVLEGGYVVIELPHPQSAGCC